jgi:hypothetical protein
VRKHAHLRLLPGVPVRVVIPTPRVRPVKPPRPVKVAPEAPLAPVASAPIAPLPPVAPSAGATTTAWPDAPPTSPPIAPPLVPPRTAPVDAWPPPAPAATPTKRRLGRTPRIKGGRRAVKSRPPARTKQTRFEIRFARRELRKAARKDAPLALKIFSAIRLLILLGLVTLAICVSIWIMVATIVTTFSKAIRG